MGFLYPINPEKTKAVNQATFLPFNTKLSVRPKSGIETLAAGYQFRFGSSTAFVCEEQSIELFSGSIFVRSRKITNVIEILKALRPQFVCPVQVLA